MKKLVFLTGAGISAESGIPTFRDSGGLWDQYRIEDICTHDAWERQPSLLLNFYNQLRRKFMNCRPNEAHRLVARCEDNYDVQVITQNIDNLHEQAGSRKVLYLHGEMMKCRADGPDTGIHYPLDPDHPDIHLGDTDANGKQLRPHIVFFQEDVPNLEQAAHIVSEADILVVIGTSLSVYPAAGLLQYAPASAQVFLIDPKPISYPYRQFIQIQKGASDGMAELMGKYL